MSSCAFALALRPRTDAPEGLAPVGPLRDRQAEARRAAERAQRALAAAAGQLAPVRVEQAARGQATAAYQNMAEKGALVVTVKPTATAAESMTQRQRRMAAISRWQKEGKYEGRDPKT